MSRREVETIKTAIHKKLPKEVVFCIAEIETKEEPILYQASPAKTKTDDKGKYTKAEILEKYPEDQFMLYFVEVDLIE